MTGLALPGVRANDVAIDSETGKLYWTDADGSIHRADLEGSCRENLLDSAESSLPIGIDLDVVPEPVPALLQGVALLILLALRRSAVFQSPTLAPQRRRTQGS